MPKYLPLFLRTSTIRIIRVGPIVCAGHLIREAWPTHPAESRTHSKASPRSYRCHHKLLHVYDVYHSSKGKRSPRRVDLGAADSHPFSTGSRENTHPNQDYCSSSLEASQSTIGG